VSIGFQDLVPSLLGGALIGLAASVLLASLGRVAGISGIVGRLLSGVDRDSGWRIGFVVGMLAIGAVLLRGAPPVTTQGGVWLLIPAGLLVGFGTRLGNGCTSGHGVCGISRLSLRSIVATGTFMTTAMLVVLVVRHVIGAAQ
jgi:uncharacterized membrane protein YedE/YeeE